MYSPPESLVLQQAPSFNSWDGVGCVTLSLEQLFGSSCATAGNADVVLQCEAVRGEDGAQASSLQHPLTSSSVCFAAVFAFPLAAASSALFPAFVYYIVSDSLF